MNSSQGSQTFGVAYFKANAVWNLVLLYVAVLLAPTTENIPGRYRNLPWLFVLRVPFRLYFWRTVLALTLLAGVNWLTRGAVSDRLLALVGWLVAQGDAGFAFIALLSPFSAVAVQGYASDEALFLFTGVLCATLILEIRAIVFALRREQEQWESSELSEWIDSREKFMEQHDRAVYNEEREIQEWSKRLCTHEGDVLSESTMTPAYESTLSPEAQTARHTLADLHRARAAAKSTVGKLLAGNSVLAMTVVLWIAWLGLRDSWPHAHWAGFVALLIVAARSQGSGELWRERLSLSVSVPIRLPQLLRVASVQRWEYNLLEDALAAALFVASWNQPKWTVVSWIAGLQLLSVSGHFQTWFGIANVRRRWWYQDFWQLLALGAWGTVFGGIAIFHMVDEWPLSRPLGPWWAPIAAGLACVVWGIMLASRLHRRTDFSIPNTRTSYSPRQEDD